MFATSASIAAPSSAGSRRSPPRCVRQCKSAPPPGQRAVCGSATGSANVAGIACCRSPRHKRMPGTAHKTPHTQHLKTRSQHCSSRCTCCRPRPRTSLPRPCTGRSHISARRTVHFCSASRRTFCCAFCALKWPPGWYLFCMLQAEAPETHHSSGRTRAASGDA